MEYKKNQRYNGEYFVYDTDGNIIDKIKYLEG